jgi:hypothetical protein
MTSQLIELAQAETAILLYISPFVLILWYILKRWGVRNIKNEQEYERLYKRINSLIENNIACKNRRYYINQQFDKLISLPWKNHEKTDVLYQRFRAKYSLILLFVLLSISAPSQKNEALYLCFQPNDLGMGLRYDHHFKKVGLYGSYSHGVYERNTTSRVSHSKIAGGIIVKSRFEPDQKHYNFFSAGPTYNVYQGQTSNTKAFKPIAAEIGAGSVFGWFTLAFRYELIKSNSSVEIGIKF